MDVNTKMVKKAILLFAILIPFLVSAVYLCPCKVMGASKGTFLAQSHDCCDRMKNCPSPKGKSKGIMSMLPALHHPDSRVEVPQHLTEIAVDFADVQVQPVIRISSLPISDAPLQTHSPPELYLKHSVLLI